MKKHRGFTLVELMITLIVIAVALTLAIPGFSRFIRDNRVTSQANDFLVSLTFARSEAIKRGRPVAVCASADSTNNSPTCTTNNDWEVGWIVFTDNDGTPGERDGTDEFLRGHAAIGGSDLAGTGPYVRFDGDGLADTAENFTLDPGGCEDNQARAITMSATGRAGIADTACP